jgi:hypothetical protein
MDGDKSVATYGVSVFFWSITKGKRSPAPQAIYKIFVEFLILS